MGSVRRNLIRYSFQRINEHMAGTKLRNMAAEDVPEIMEIAENCRLSRWSITDYADELMRNDSVMIAAESGSKVLGFLVARFVP